MMWRPGINIGKIKMHTGGAGVKDIDLTPSCMEKSILYAGYIAINIIAEYTGCVLSTIWRSAG